MTSQNSEAMRAEFEKWALMKGYFPAHIKDKYSDGNFRDGQYKYHSLEKDWRIWQAARAAPAIPQADLDRYEALEKEHLGDPDKKTGIYALTPDSLAARKTAHVMSQGYQIVGHILRKPGGDYALSAEGAVRWLKPPEYWKLMHGPFDSKITITLSRNMSGDPILQLSNGQSFEMKDIIGMSEAVKLAQDDKKDTERLDYIIEKTGKFFDWGDDFRNKIDEAIAAQIESKEKL